MEWAVVKQSWGLVPLADGSDVPAGIAGTDARSESDRPHRGRRGGSLLERPPPQSSTSESPQDRAGKNDRTSPRLTLTRHRSETPPAEVRHRSARNRVEPLRRRRLEDRRWPCGHEHLEELEVRDPHLPRTRQRKRPSRNCNHRHDRAHLTARRWAVHEGSAGDGRSEPGSTRSGTTSSTISPKQPARNKTNETFRQTHRAGKRNTHRPPRPWPGVDVFTAPMGTWWPLSSRSIAEHDAVDVRIEPRIGGRVVEVTDDGSEHPWADVIAWDPPHRVVLARHPSREPDAATILEIRFNPMRDGGTQVDLEHRGWEQLGSS